MKDLLQKIGFFPKENETGLFIKKYPSFDNYIIEVDFEKKLIDYGKKITSESKGTQNFTQAENWVVLECVDRLLSKGYKPEDLTLEKVYPTGHGTSGRLDILVHKNKKAYLIIECKTFGNEFTKEFNNLNKNGGQLFTYFQQDRDAEYLVLYASKFENDKIQYVNEIVKIEDSYRETSNVKDFYDRWSKLTSQNGLFDEWVDSYNFKSKALTLNQLKTITQKDSSFIFNRFLEILRHNVVSDKPNAFNKIFTLFLCKIVDENRNPYEQLDFQWIEGVDDDISFQKRLTDLYKKGMQELLSKEVTDISDDDFNKKYAYLDDQSRKSILEEITKIRLQKNNEFAIKEVFDEETFNENAKVLKEVVELLQIYKIRYAEKQQYLSDFFELLLNTGLKQESGQFFTPVPLARFICRAIPLNKIIESKLKAGEAKNLLPTTIDYATGSGHFLTESMNEIQNIIQTIDDTKLKPQVKSEVSVWKAKPFNWAHDYIYGIEKDYRLVKTAKVGCYLHGDGVAQVIHTDGLNNFNNTEEYRNKLKGSNKDFPQDNKKFDIVISNPPYSVSAFKTNLKREFAEKDFELYKYLTDQSSEIECLFIERTKQLLKDGGIAGIILPSSMLSNTGIYTKTREIILKYFDIIGITELGSNTFMATNTNTVVLFLKRKNNYDWQNIKSSVDKFSTDLKDITVNKVENIFSKYVDYVWEEISFNDYISIFEKNPTNTILNHEIYKEYQKVKLAKNEQLIDKIIEIEKDKLLYFILTYSQKVILVKSGEKKIEKAFLGYEFSNRRGSEGIHPIQRGKLIDECTKLFDPQKLNNPTKASTYILDAFENDFEREIDEELKNHISRVDLVDMMTWDRNNFEKNINLNIKKKVKIESKWDIIKIEQILKEIINGSTPSKKEGKYWDKKEVNWLTIPDFNDSSIYLRETSQFTTKQALSDNLLKVIPKNSVMLSCTATIGKVNINKIELTTNQQINSIICNDKIIPEYLAFYLKTQKNNLENLTSNSGVKHINLTMLNNFKIPLPPKNTQEKIIKEIIELEKKENNFKDEIEELEKSIKQMVSNNTKEEKLDNIKTMLSRGKSPKYGNSNTQIIKSGQARGYNEFDFSEKHYVSNDFILDERKLEKGDILINSSGVGTAGRVTLFDLDGDFVVDSHISILRLDKTKANPDYILYSLANIGFKTIESMAMGQSGQIELSQATIKNIKIPLPTIQEQNKIVKQIKKIEIQISELKTQVNKIPKLKERVLNKYL
jgi:type I restriction enzyme M protein